MSFNTTLTQSRKVRRGLRGFFVSIFWAFAVLSLLNHCNAGEHPSPVFHDPPRIAISANELAALKARPDFAATKEAAKKAADPLIEKPVTLPDGFGSWVFYYACADDGTTLHAISANEHECPKCHKHFNDERTIAAYRGILHNEAEHAALKLAWAYAYTGEEKYGDGVKRILIKFADDYPKYPERIDRWGRRGFFARLGGRRRAQALEEAEGIIPLAKAYDLTRTSKIWTDTERLHVEKDFFRLTADTLLLYPMGIENRQAWYNAGVLAIAAVLGDASLVEKALFAPNGFIDVLNRGVGEDGFWWEGTMSYQSYVVQPMIQTIDLARRMEIQLQENQKFKNLLLSPLRATYPNGIFPAINDSDPANYHMFDFSFEWAWKTYKDPRFAQALHWQNPEKLKELLGPEAAPKCPLDAISSNLQTIGLLFLRAGSGANSVCVTNHYGTPGGDASGHGHWDKLSVTLFANDREWLADIGRIGYSHKEYAGWAKRTVAHNTVAINQVDQLIDTGKLLWLQAGETFAAAAVQSDGAYPNTTLRRYMFLTPEFFVDVFKVSTDHPSTIDLSAHAVCDSLQPVEKLTSHRLASLGDNNGYQYLKDILEFSPAQNSSWSFRVKESQLRVHFVAEPDEQIYTAIGVGFSPEQPAPCLIRRRKAKETCFVSAYDLSRTADQIQSVQLLDKQKPCVRILSGRKTYEILFGSDKMDISTR